MLYDIVQIPLYLNSETLGFTFMHVSQYHHLFSTA